MKMILYFSLTILSLAGCKSSSDGTSTDGNDESSPEVYYKTIDGEEVTGNENLILECLKDINFCKSVCIAVPFPEQKRYSLFATNYLAGSGKCVLWKMSYPNGTTYNEAQYYIGDYQAQGLSGKCANVNIASPDFNGLYGFEEVRVPEGQVSPHPSGLRFYYTLNLLETNLVPSGSYILNNYNPPASWTYRDNSVSTGTITPQLVNGFSCVKDQEITNTVINNLEI